MKTQDFGWSYYSPLDVTGMGVGYAWGGQFMGRRLANKHYQDDRANGSDGDSPARDIPLDGKYTDWIECPDTSTLPSPLADGSYKEGYTAPGYYRIRYQEGPGDKAWMEERDGNYLARLEREGQAEKATCLRASLPASHPHYRALTPAAPAPSRSSDHSPTRPSRSGGGTGAGAPPPQPGLSVAVMKTQVFGWSMPWHWVWRSRRPAGWRPGATVGDYQKNRINGRDEDSPANGIPLDGKFSNWIKCPDKDALPSPLADGTYKESWHGKGYYRIHYQEGPGDKAWMEERDGNYLARLEREGQAEKVARLRASLPASHPHYRTLTPVVPVPSHQTRRATPHTCGQGAGAGAAAPSPTPSRDPIPPAAGASVAAPTDPLASAFELQAAGDHRQAIRLLNAYLGEHPGTARAHRFRGFSRMKWATTVCSRAQKKALLESAKSDYTVVLNADPMDEEAGAAIDTIDQQLASTPVAGAGAGVGAAPVPAMTLFQAVGRVWGGKYATDGTQPVYVPHTKKSEGCAIGAIYRKTPSKPGASHAGKLWLGKVGFNQSERDERALRTHSLVRRGSSVDSIREKIAADTYALLSRGQYFVPKHRLAKLPVINEFTRENVLAQTLVEGMNRGRTERKDTAVHLMSKWIDGYHNLDTAQVKNPDGSIGPIMAYIDAQHTLPEQIVVDGREMPLLGMVEVLAAARLLGDTDVLGGSGKNAGYVIERNSDGTPVAARAVKIDAGNAFNFEGADNRFTQCFNRRTRPSMRLANLRDLQFGNNMPVDIEWDKLTDGQRSAFLSALQHGLNCLKIPMTLRFLIKRDGEFNRAEAGLMSDRLVSELIEIWERDLREQESEEVYGTMLAEIRTSASTSP